MKLRAVLLVAALFSILSAQKAQASLINFSATNTVGEYEITGTLAPDASATFEFTVAGTTFLPPQSPNGYIGLYGEIGSLAPTYVTSSPFTIGTALTSYFVGQGSSATPSITNVSNTFYFPTGTNSANPVSVSPIVFVTANLLDAHHMSMTFTNLNSLIASFTADMENPNGTVAFGQLVSVAAVPLPATFILFLTGMVALSGFAYLRKARARH